MHRWNDHHRLVIGTNYSNSEQVLPSLIAQLKARYPEMNILARVAPSNQLNRMLMDNELDIALMGSAPEHELFSCRHLGSDRFVAVLPPKHPLTEKEQVSLQDLTAMPFFAREPGSANRMIVDDALALAGVDITPLVESTSVHYIIHAVARQAGASILPERVVSVEAAQGMVATRPIDAPGFVRDTYIVWRKSHYLTPVMHEIIDLLRQLAEQTQA
ncbi:MAG: LysR family transcriptional regulator substrate-binding protein [Clostridia bacterium]|nr:LysR family transcriptional regulator substrate-binding protein [Clostridia bacterium]